MELFPFRFLVATDGEMWFSSTPSILRRARLSLKLLLLHQWMRPKGAASSEITMLYFLHNPLYLLLRSFAMRTATAVGAVSHQAVKEASVWAMYSAQRGWRGIALGYPRWLRGALTGGSPRSHCAELVWRQSAAMKASVATAAKRARARGTGIPYQLLFTEKNDRAAVSTRDLAQFSHRILE